MKAETPPPSISATVRLPARSHRADPETGDRSRDEGFTVLLATVGRAIARHEGVERVSIGCVAVDGGEAAMLAVDLVVGGDESWFETLAATRTACGRPGPPNGEPDVLVAVLDEVNLGSEVLRAHHLERLGCPARSGSMAFVGHGDVQWCVVDPSLPEDGVSELLNLIRQPNGRHPAMRILLHRADSESERRDAPFTVVHGRGPCREHDATVLDLIRRQIAATPSKAAQVHESTVDTYAGLGLKASAVARFLDDLGVRRGDRVACHLVRGLTPLIALLGVWTAGAVYVPIDPALPPERQRVQYELAGCAAALGTDDVERVCATVQDTTPSTENLRQAPVGMMESSPDDEAYVLFTSGSTGTPKAVSMPHRAMANLISWQLRQPELATPPRIAQFATLSFDVSVQEMLVSAASGGTLVVVPERSRRNPQELLSVLDQSDVSVAFLPVAALHQLAAASETFGIAPRALRHIITAGEALVVTDQVRALGAATGCRLVNQYGPTETHVTTYFRLGSVPADWPERPPIGWPIDNTIVRVVDESGRPCRLGETGELHLGGENVAAGYLGVGTDAGGGFSTEAGIRWYRTGDLVRLGAEGALYFAGRTDDQVKIRGHRVEPTEVVAVLLRHPEIKACAVQSADSVGGLGLIAYLEAGGVTAEQVREHAGTYLPEYAVPAHLEFVDRLPTTRSGKIDHRRLPSAPRRTEVPAENPVPGDTESRVVRVWEDLLGKPVPSAQMSFVDAGGNSLAMLELYLRLRAVFERDFPMHELFSRPTAAAFAEFLDEQDE
ncbi:non-ribosomal peptide synthetase [Actinoalloteichus hymeniacidonis]|uniref:Amino acid adenylation enzyme/thioester reductase family protein n=1 Tax=Actinoalloteichus hymeniacidonis TaxID=340345 RepID=A0AAC9HR10_9PSEU|nr:non-ribosomal peptide synthetase [Actinoalloteichus hymeniacidonis]AOS63964.1 amino acid adenylation enzyme/thioester reductase family protein [Actinoalloteichus hymeniacidonis]MBB5907978.1 amino acid adenylation domain-containing protein [Actinoalloteichus hymeniacidonis]